MPGFKTAGEVARGGKFPCILEMLSKSMRMFVYLPPPYVDTGLVIFGGFSLYEERKVGGNPPSYLRAQGVCTHTHTHAHIPLGLTPFSQPCITTPFPAWRRVLRLIPMVPFGRWRLTNSVHTHYSPVLAHRHRLVTRGQPPMSHSYLYAPQC